jgi:predicted SnoaL-like aldol condensation-catalyzing enzyme
MEKWSPAVPALRAVRDHVEATVNPYRRYKHHSAPDTEDDINKLVAYFVDTDIFQCKPKRKGQISEAGRFPNAVQLGLQKLQKDDGAYLEAWWEGRHREYNSEQNWDIAPSGDEDESGSEETSSEVSV